MRKKRDVARLILMNQAKRFLLLNGFGRVPERTGNVSFWITPGGGVEDGEDFEQALRREAWEEIALELQDIGHRVWSDEFIIRFDETTVEFHSRYNFLPVSDHQVALTNLDDKERQSVQAYRWWSLDDMQASDELFQPLNLPALLQPLVNGHLPEQTVHLVRSQAHVVSVCILRK